MHIRLVQGVTHRSHQLMIPSLDKPLLKRKSLNMALKNPKLTQWKWKQKIPYTK